MHSKMRLLMKQTLLVKLYKHSWNTIYSFVKKCVHLKQLLCQYHAWWSSEPVEATKQVEAEEAAKRATAGNIT